MRLIMGRGDNGAGHFSGWVSETECQSCQQNERVGLRKVLEDILKKEEITLIY